MTKYPARARPAPANPKGSFAWLLWPTAVLTIVAVVLANAEALQMPFGMEALRFRGAGGRDGVMLTEVRAVTISTPSSLEFSWG